MEKIRIGIAGYGNLGRGVECAVKQNPDMEIAGIYTRRDPSAVKPLTEGVKVFKIDALEEKQDIDVLIDLALGVAHLVEEVASVDFVPGIGVEVGAAL